ncbi:hypothetical protein D910_00684 [Dendroctonus ponderosae]|uniref:Fumarate lyase N-terminal domain-containing protein n=1 Tax=Dendroctonus ponderosae TaxID=77166 RepID=U4V008_DENPD|nr:hypothetical protein D910_00684 [Dendroctonus ponderosae]
MYAEDIEGSKAYAHALQNINLLTEDEEAQICQGLDKIRIEWDNTEFVTLSEDEDIHSSNERRLKELIGEPATKLHVGRSRNDQVVTDMKLWMKTNLAVLRKAVEELIHVIVKRALQEIDVIMPGYTHLQRAQPVRWSHYLLR